jgi:hypothetical protein
MVDANGNYKIPAGQTFPFIAYIRFSPANGSSGSYRAQLVNVNYNTTDSGSIYSTYTDGLNSGKFSTPYVTGN